MAVLTRMWSNWNSHAVLVVIENDIVTLENGWAVPCTINHAFTRWPRNSTPQYLPKRNENLSPQKDLYKNVDSSFIYNLPKRGNNPNILQRMNGWTNSYNGVIISDKQELLIWATTCINLKNMLSQKKQDIGISTVWLIYISF